MLSTPGAQMGRQEREEQGVGRTEDSNRKMTSMMVSLAVEEVCEMSAQS